MKRTTKKERMENAIKFYNFLKNNGRAVVVVERTESTNINCAPAKFVVAQASLESNVAVIAESKLFGKEGCFYELLSNINPVYPQKSCWMDGFKDWVHENYGIKITYDDGYAMIFEV